MLITWSYLRNVRYLFHLERLLRRNYELNLVGLAFCSYLQLYQHQQFGLWFQPYLI